MNMYLPSEFVEWIYEHFDNICSNAVTLQEVESQSCGQYALMYLKFKARGKPTEVVGGGRRWRWRYKSIAIVNEMKSNITKRTTVFDQTNIMMMNYTISLKERTNDVQKQLYMDTNKLVKE